MAYKNILLTLLGIVVCRFGTIANLQGSDDSSDGDEQGQAFYAGGSEHSGQQILGPSKKKKDFVSEMFKSVRE
jgi:UBX domain-containing protein 1